MRRQRQRLISHFFQVTAILVLAAASTAEPPGGRPLAADLLDANEVPAVMTGAFGFADVSLNAGRGTAALDIFVDDTTAPITRIHIHRAAAGVNGPIVVFFFDTVVDPSLDPIPVGEDGVFLHFEAEGVDRGLIREIMLNPAGFYVNVHTTMFPGGELRGQLGSPRMLHAALIGDNENPPVNTDGAAMADVRFSLGSASVDLDLTIADLNAPVTRIHIHRAPVGVNGPIVVFFFDVLVDPTLMPFETAGGVHVDFLAEGVDPGLLQEILMSPQDFYVNVHSIMHPGGEIRGQLVPADD